jgi:uncharacterized protein
MRVTIQLPRKAAISLLVPLIAFWASTVSAAPVATGRYIVDDRVLIKTPGGVTLSAVMVRRRGVTAKQPAALEFTIYAQPARDIARLHYAADRGYVGIVAYSRGKVDSPQPIAPYEFDGRDADGVIDWIAKQPWSNGKVGMYGGSYDGFSQWAAAKHVPAALKTIVPYVAENPGNGLPMQNNIFLPVNYAWIYYVTDNKLLDDATYNSPAWRGLNAKWYASGRAYRDIDAVAGRPNPWLRKWLQHPSYDAYWQSLLPYRADFARINIPVLSITGYYDDGQISALAFVHDHMTFNDNARDYVVIGPWDHFGSQRAVKPDVLRGYRLDPVAHLSTPKLTFDWLDYVMRGGPKPTLLRDRINYEVMGSNVWRHAPSIGAMGTLQRFYMNPSRVSRRFFLLSSQPPAHVASLRQRVDFRDRNTQTNDSYPFPVLGRKPDMSGGLWFLTQPFPKPVVVSDLDGTLRAIVNKRDMDVGLAMYEMLPDGRLFQLSSFMARASYAKDMAERHLLTPGVVADIPIDHATLFSRRLSRGSRLLLTITVNKNAFAELNYGTGKDVSTEDIHDADAPFDVRWLTSSVFGLRLSPA